MEIEKQMKNTEIQSTEEGRPLQLPIDEDVNSIIPRTALKHLSLLETGTFSEAVKSWIINVDEEFTLNIDSSEFQQLVEPFFTEIISYYKAHRYDVELLFELDSTWQHTGMLIFGLTPLPLRHLKFLYGMTDNQGFKGPTLTSVIQALPDENIATLRVGQTNVIKFDLPFIANVPFYPPTADSSSSDVNWQWSNAAFNLLAFPTLLISTITPVRAPASVSKTITLRARARAKNIQASQFIYGRV